MQGGGQCKETESQTNYFERDTMGFKVEKRAPVPPQKTIGGSSPKSVLVALFFLIFLAWSIRQLVFPTYDVCDVCAGTGVLSCGAPGCVNGKVRCPASCLKRDDPGWQHLDVPGHNPNDLWMRFDNDDGGSTAWTQAHIGELIVKVDGHWVDQGACPVCHATGWIPCPVCHGGKVCPVCKGEGRLRRWGFW
jgi:hypothetical protein